MKTEYAWSIFLVLATAAALAGCGPYLEESGNMEKILTVTGPVRLEVASGPGSVRILPGNSGRVRIAADFRVESWFGRDPRDIVESFRKSPPIEQQGNSIRIWRPRADGPRAWNMVVHYVLEVPKDTEVTARLGSGDVEVRGLQGRVRVETGSGDVAIENVTGDVEAEAGSGDIRIREAAGAVRASTHSGQIELDQIQGEVRAAASSGDVRVTRPGGNVYARTTSGEIEVRDATADLTVEVTSGDISIAGNPRPKAFWDVRSRSGSVDLDVPANASFVFQAEARSGRIDADTLLEVTERSRHQLRGRMGTGSARVIVEAGSGSISLY